MRPEHRFAPQLSMASLMVVPACASELAAEGGTQAGSAAGPSAFAHLRGIR